jgi:hypothetical protein
MDEKRSEKMRRPYFEMLQESQIGRFILLNDEGGPMALLPMEQPLRDI